MATCDKQGFTSSEETIKLAGLGLYKPIERVMDQSQIGGYTCYVKHIIFVYTQLFTVHPTSLCECKKTIYLQFAMFAGGAFLGCTHP